ncbi:alpha/beta fold hydrolase [Actinomadura spongiicola]|uniref:alpha/beta fold hydrolase n=1 Tax=Actinomadura spongiicola TaxID=2303421 RepID=UPI0018F214FB|nr:hypothetical protein [Actinomadura spongiicola]
MEDERLVPVNGVKLCVQTFGEPTGSGEVREWLARTPRRVVRYDLRDTGQSTTGDPDNPGYTLRDLVTDAAELRP